MKKNNEMQKLDNIWLPKRQCANFPGNKLLIRKGLYLGVVEGTCKKMEPIGWLRVVNEVISYG